MDFLVDMTTRVPRGTSPEALDDIRARESVRARELATEGHLLRLWRRTLTGKHAATLTESGCRTIGSSDV